MVKNLNKVDLSWTLKEVKGKFGEGREGALSLEEIAEVGQLLHSHLFGLILQKKTTPIGINQVKTLDCPAMPAARLSQPGDGKEP